jgi:16S rRNA (cytosine1402-N4)-methyltransferase
MLNETIEVLKINPSGIYVDATLGGGGHSELILKQLTSGHLYAFDQDSYAITKAQSRLQKYENNLTIIKSNFLYIKEELLKLGITKIDGIIFDLGLSSFQIDDSTRGFSYMSDSLLDMRMDLNSSFSAFNIVNEYSYTSLRDIFFKYGEEKNASNIAKVIIERRPLSTTKEIVDICDKLNYKEKGHSSKKVFQALRIETNNEIKILENTLVKVLPLLKTGGIIAVISFHSLEDRIVKHFFLDNAKTNIPKEIVILNAEKPPLTILTRHPILPSDKEILENSRSKSAKLRAAIKN